MTLEALRVTAGGLEVRLHVQPKASKTAFAGVHGDRLKLRVQAKPVEGAANAAVVAFLAAAAGTSKSQVALIRGETSREKDVRIVCDDPEAAVRRIRKASGIND